MNKDELLISQLFDAQPESVFWMKPLYNYYDETNQVIDFEIFYTNIAGAKLMNVSQQEALGKHFKADRVLGGSSEILAFEQSLQVFLSGTSADFTYFNEALKKYFYVTRTKVNGGILNIARDITTEISEKIKITEQSEFLKKILNAAEKANAEVERSAGKLRKFIDSVHSGMSYFLPVTDHAGEVTDFRYDITNASFAAYAGARPDDVIGQLLSKWHPSYKKTSLFQKYKETFNSGLSNRFEIHYRGEELDGWYDVLVIKMDEGILVTTTDLTTVKKLQITLETSVKDLKKSNASLQEFAYVASHDLQEPLRKIQVFADKLKKDIPSLSKENQNVFDRMVSATLRMSQLIHDLLAYSQISTKLIEFKTVDLMYIVPQVVLDLETAIAEKKAVVSFESLPQIKGDPLQLRQLFQNLISNSLKYCREDISPFVRITAKKVEKEVNGVDHPYYQIIFSDNGIGFEQQHAERIFKLFQRLHGRSEYPGTGIGLAIVQKVIDNHKGFITAESEPGSGCVFTLLLPA